MTRTVPAPGGCFLGPAATAPAAGDVLAARVTALGDITCVDDQHGSPCRLWPGDVVVGVLASRYATQLYEATAHCTPSGADLLSSGGTFGTVTAAHDDLTAPTRLEVLGHVTDGSGQTLRLGDFALPTDPARLTTREQSVPPVIGVVGTGTNSGKTTAWAAIVHALSLRGVRVGVSKVTGGGAGRDRFIYLDAGAHAVVGFLDFGMASTYGYPRTHLERVMEAMPRILASRGADAVILELADGLLQDDTRVLASALPRLATATVLAAADPLGAQAGVDVLTALGARPTAVTGLLTSSPLFSREASAATGLPVVAPDDLAPVVDAVLSAAGGGAGINDDGPGG